jgi:hypothetical protein
MTIQFNSIEKLGPSAWRFAWTDTTAPYRIFLEGRLVITAPTNTVSLDLEDYPTYPPPIEVIDATMDDTDALSVSYPPYITLQWIGVAAAVVYRIEYYSGGTWIPVDTIDGGGEGYYTFETTKIDNNETAQWRIVPLDAQENEGTPLSFNFSVVGAPDSPELVSHEYSGGSIQIGA